MRRKVEDWYWHVGSELHRMGEELTRSRPAVATGRCWEPRVDIMDLEDRLLVRAEIAGMRGEEIGLLYNVERHSLLIRGVRSEDLSDAGHCQFHQMEIPFGEFEREVKLPDVVIQPEGIRARYANGFLFVAIPKAEHVVVTTVTVREI